MLGDCSLVWSAGFALYEWGARGSALGGAAIARADDPCALAFNPAGITRLEGVQASFGSSMISPKVTAVVSRGNTTTSTDTRDLLLFPSNVYFTCQCNDRSWFGLGLYSRFGLSTRFPANWAGRYGSYCADIESYSLNPDWAFKISDELSAAIGLEAMYFAIVSKNKIADPGFAGGEIDSRITADDLALGANLGLHYQPGDRLSLSLTCRSNVNQNLRGEVQYSPSSVPYPLDPTVKFFHNSNGSGKIRLPASISAGVAVSPIEQLSAEFSLIYTGWSSFDKLVIDLSTPPNPADPASSHQKIPKDWHNTWRYQLGLEYAVNDWLDLRAGSVFDESPIDEHHLDYMVPNNDLAMFSLGTGFHWIKWTMDIAYTSVLSRDRKGIVVVEGDPVDRSHAITFKNGYAHSLAISIGYTF